MAGICATRYNLLERILISFLSILFYLLTCHDWANGVWRFDLISTGFVCKMLATMLTTPRSLAASKSAMLLYAQM
jgi:hypothetical protein